MATEAETPDPVAEVKLEEEKEITCGQIETVDNKASSEDVQKVDDATSLPLATVENYPKAEKTEVPHSSKNEIVNPDIEGKIGISESESFSQSPSLSIKSLGEIHNASKDSEDQLNPGIKTEALKNESQLQKDQTKESVEVTDNTVRDDKINARVEDVGLVRFPELPTEKQNIKENTGENLPAIPAPTASNELRVREGKTEGGDGAVLDVIEQTNETLFYDKEGPVEELHHSDNIKHHLPISDDQGIEAIFASQSIQEDKAVFSSQKDETEGKNSGEDSDMVNDIAQEPHNEEATTPSALETHNITINQEAKEMGFQVENLEGIENENYPEDREDEKQEGDVHSDTVLNVSADTTSSKYHSNEADISEIEILSFDMVKEETSGGESCSSASTSTITLEEMSPKPVGSGKEKNEENAVEHEGQDSIIIDTTERVETKVDEVSEQLEKDESELKQSGVKELTSETKDTSLDCKTNDADDSTNVTPIRQVNMESKITDASEEIQEGTKEKEHAAKDLTAKLMGELAGNESSKEDNEPKNLEGKVNEVLKEAAEEEHNEKHKEEDGTISMVSNKDENEAIEGLEIDGADKNIRMAILEEGVVPDLSSTTVKEEVNKESYEGDEVHEEHNSSPEEDAEKIFDDEIEAVVALARNSIREETVNNSSQGTEVYKELQITGAGKDSVEQNMENTSVANNTTVFCREEATIENSQEDKTEAMEGKDKADESILPKELEAPESAEKVESVSLLDEEEQHENQDAKCVTESTGETVQNNYSEECDDNSVKLSTEPKDIAEKIETSNVKDVNDLHKSQDADNIKETTEEETIHSEITEKLGEATSFVPQVSEQRKGEFIEQEEGTNDILQIASFEETGPEGKRLIDVSEGLDMAASINSIEISTCKSEQGSIKNFEESSPEDIRKRKEEITDRLGSNATLKEEVVAFTDLGAMGEDLKLVGLSEQNECVAVESQNKHASDSASTLQLLEDPVQGVIEDSDVVPEENGDFPKEKDHIKESAEMVEGEESIISQQVETIDGATSLELIQSSEIESMELKAADVSDPVEVLEHNHLKENIYDAKEDEEKNSNTIFDKDALQGEVIEERDMEEDGAVNHHKKFLRTDETVVLSSYEDEKEQKNIELEQELEDEAKIPTSGVANSTIIKIESEEVCDQPRTSDLCEGTEKVNKEDSVVKDITSVCTEEEAMDASLEENKRESSKPAGEVSGEHECTEIEVTEEEATLKEHSTNTIGEEALKENSQIDEQVSKEHKEEEVEGLELAGASKDIEEYIIEEKDVFEDQSTIYIGESIDKESSKEDENEDKKSEEEVFLGLETTNDIKAHTTEVAGASDTNYTEFMGEEMVIERFEENDKETVTITVDESRDDKTSAGKDIEDRTLEMDASAASFMAPIEDVKTSTYEKEVHERLGETNAVAAVQIQTTKELYAPEISMLPVREQTIETGSQEEEKKEANVSGAEVKESTITYSEVGAHSTKEIEAPPKKEEDEAKRLTAFSGTEAPVKINDELSYTSTKSSVSEEQVKEELQNETENTSNEHEPAPLPMGTEKLILPEARAEGENLVDAVLTSEEILPAIKTDGRSSQILDGEKKISNLEENAIRDTFSKDADKGKQENSGSSDEGSVVMPQSVDKNIETIFAAEITDSKAFSADTSDEKPRECPMLSSQIEELESVKMKETTGDEPPLKYEIMDKDLEVVQTKGETYVQKEEHLNAEEASEIGIKYIEKINSNPALDNEILTSEAKAADVNLVSDKINELDDFNQNSIPETPDPDFKQNIIKGEKRYGAFTEEDETTGACDNTETIFLDKKDNPVKELDQNFKETTEERKEVENNLVGINSKHEINETYTTENVTLVQKNHEAADPCEELRKSHSTETIDQDQSQTNPETEKIEVVNDEEIIQDQGSVSIDGHTVVQSFQAEEKEKHDLEEVGYKLNNEVQHDLMKDVNHPMEGSIVNKEMPHGVERADENENIEKQTIEEDVAAKNVESLVDDTLVKEVTDSDFRSTECNTGVLYCNEKTETETLMYVEDLNEKVVDNPDTDASGEEVPKQEGCENLEEVYNTVSDVSENNMKKDIKEEEGDNGGMGHTAPVLAVTEEVSAQKAMQEDEKSVEGFGTGNEVKQKESNENLSYTSTKSAVSEEQTKEEIPVETENTSNEHEPASLTMATEDLSLQEEYSSQGLDVEHVIHKKIFNVDENVTGDAFSIEADEGKHEKSESPEEASIVVPQSVDKDIETPFAAEITESKAFSSDTSDEKPQERPMFLSQEQELESVKKKETTVDEPPVKYEIIDKDLEVVHTKGEINVQKNEHLNTEEGSEIGFKDIEKMNLNPVLDCEILTSEAKAADVNLESKKINELNEFSKDSIPKTPDPDFKENKIKDEEKYDAFTEELETTGACANTETDILEKNDNPVKEHDQKSKETREECNQVEEKLVGINGKHETNESYDTTENVTLIQKNAEVADPCEELEKPDITETIDHDQIQTLLEAEKIEVVKDEEVIHDQDSGSTEHHTVGQSFQAEEKENNDLEEAESELNSEVQNDHMNDVNHPMEETTMPHGVERADENENLEKQAIDEEVAAKDVEALADNTIIKEVRDSDFRSTDSMERISDEETSYLVPQLPNEKSEEKDQERVTAVNDGNSIQGSDNPVKDTEESSGEDQKNAEAVVPRETFETADLEKLEKTTESISITQSSAEETSVKVGELCEEDSDFEPKKHKRSAESVSEVQVHETQMVAEITEDKEDESAVKGYNTLSVEDGRVGERFHEEENGESVKEAEFKTEAEAEEDKNKKTNEANEKTENDTITEEVPTWHENASEIENNERPFLGEQKAANASYLVTSDENSIKESGGAEEKKIEKVNEEATRLGTDEQNPESNAEKVQKEGEDEANDIPEYSNEEVTEGPKNGGPSYTTEKQFMKVEESVEEPHLVSEGKESLQKGQQGEETKGLKLEEVPITMEHGKPCFESEGVQEGRETNESTEKEIANEVIKSSDLEEQNVKQEDVTDKTETGSVTGGVDRSRELDTPPVINAPSEEAPTEVSKELEESDTVPEDPIHKMVTERSENKESAVKDETYLQNLFEYEKPCDSVSRTMSMEESHITEELPADNPNALCLKEASLKQTHEKEGTSADDEEKEVEVVKQGTYQVSLPTAENEENIEDQAPVPEISKESAKNLTKLNSQEKICADEEGKTQVLKQAEIPQENQMLNENDDVLAEAQISMETDYIEKTEEIPQNVKELPADNPDASYLTEASQEEMQEKEGKSTDNEEKEEAVFVKQGTNQVSIPTGQNEKNTEDEAPVAEKSIDGVKKLSELNSHDKICADEEEETQVLKQAEISQDLNMVNETDTAPDEKQTSGDADFIEKKEDKTTGSTEIPSIPETLIEQSLQTAEDENGKHGERQENDSEMNEVECEADKRMHNFDEETNTNQEALERGLSSYDLVSESSKETVQTVGQLEGEQYLPLNKEEPENKDEPTIEVKKDTKTEENEKDGEGEEEDDHRKEDSGSDAPVMVEASRDIDVKPTPKKSHNILSGVGSKVKHSISKVKKAIIGKSSHHHK